MRIKLKIHLALWVLFFVAAIPVLAYAVDGQIKIGQTASTTFPIVIDQPGSYVLTSNIVVSTPGVHGIEITADNVTLDLNGHALIGPRSGTSRGIYALGTNISIMNGTVESFGDSGVIINSNGEIKNMRAHNNGRMGITAHSSIITNCVASYNFNGGISASQSTVTTSEADHNGGPFGGICGTGSTITNCTATFNDGIGVSGFNIAGSTLTQCTATDNNIGIKSSASTIENCVAINNKSHGIFDLGGSMIRNSTAWSNDGSGIAITQNGNARIEGNNLRNNGQVGIKLLGNNNYVVRNAASNNINGNYYDAGTNNYMPTSLTSPDAANANVGW